MNVYPLESEFVQSYKSDGIGRRLKNNLFI